MANEQNALNDCGCCEGVSAQTPLRIENRPGLSAIAYRVGTHSSFKQSLLAGLSSAPAPMRDLSTRDDDDFTIALLDAWATVGDVLTFYQERIANENYLRTSAERLSLFELARLIGYRPKPGIAAVAALAFTVDGNVGSPQPAHIPTGTKVQSVPGVDETPQTFETIEAMDARAEWNALKLKTTVPQLCAFNTSEAWFDGVAVNLKVGDVLVFVSSEREGNPASTRWDWARVTDVFVDADNKRTRATLHAPLTHVNPQNVTAVKPKAYALRLRASLFGHNAPDPKLLPSTTLPNYTGSTTGSGATLAWSFTIDTAGKVIVLDNAYSTIFVNSWLVMNEPDNTALYKVVTVSESSLTKFALSGKSTRIVLDTDTLLSTFAGTDYPQTLVFAQSELLPLSDALPLPAAQTTGLVDDVTLDAEITALPANRKLIVEGKLADGTTAVEEMTLASATDLGNATRLSFTTALTHNYVLNTVTIYANVAKATHGETVNELLGNGDGARTYQSFALKNAPLTYVSDANAEGGAASTLQVHVNDVLWSEASTLYARQPKERIYTARLTDDEKTVVQFGDGVTGARLPTGAMNVRATYRKGAGATGNLLAGQLSTLMTRPLGVTGAINPLPSSGGEDAEQRDDARENAPLTVLTLDRVVSLRDYEDFARAFAGVKKALATWSWVGQERVVFLTVAGTDGADIAEDSDIFTNLFTALQAKGDLRVPLRMKTYREVIFGIALKVKADPAYMAETVRATVKQALLDAFSFEQRRFGQPVHLSEVMAAAQDVAGVLAVDVDILIRFDFQGGNALKQPLPAAMPAVDANGDMLAAELLVLADWSVFVGDMP